MKNLIAFVFITLIPSYSLPIIGIEFRQATHSDIQGIVDLINTEAYKDSDKIVVVPKIFRTIYIQSAINKGRIFVASNNEQIIGYKKLFCITDAEELDDILINELRCKNSNPVVCKSVSIPDLTSQNSSSEDIIQIFSSPATYIYNGADFTHPNYRGQGINTQLTKYALNFVVKSTIEQIKDQKSSELALIYGLTQANAGKEDNVLDGRTNGIIKQFIPFAELIAKAYDLIPPSILLLSRHYAFKPSFDPKSTECRPLSDEQSIPGYGCLITYKLKQKSE